MNISVIAIVSLAVTMPVMASGLIDPQDDGLSARPMEMMSTTFLKACSISSAGGEAVLSATVQGMPVHSDIVGPGPGGGPHVRAAATDDKHKETIEIASWSRAGAGGPHVKVFDGVNFTIASSPGGGMPVVHAMAINTKGTGASNGRLLLPAVQKTRDAAARHAINTKGTGTDKGRTASLACASGYSEARTAPPASCSISGNPDAPDVTFTLPVSAFGSAKTGHVSLIKRSADGAMRATASLSDGSSIVATCDSSKLGDDMIATYDLKMAKK